VAAIRRLRRKVVVSFSGTTFFVFVIVVVVFVSVLVLLRLLLVPTTLAAALDDEAVLPVDDTDDARGIAVVRGDGTGVDDALVRLLLPLRLTVFDSGSDGAIASLKWFLVLLL